MVDAGDPLASLYSPDLLSTIQNLQIAKSNNNNETLLASARTKLELLGIDSKQINALLASAKPDTHATIYSPIAGHVIKKNVREGQYVDEGDVLYEVADLSSVWILAQVYEDDLGFLPLGQAHKHSTIDQG